MNTQVAYRSKTGNTERIARAMADELGCPIIDIPTRGAPVAADLLFVGGAVYATHDHGLDPELIRFLRALDPAKVKRVALFCTGFSDAALAAMKGSLASRGIEIVDESFFCKGRFLLFNLGHPDSGDLANARAFAKKAAGRQ